MFPRAQTACSLMCWWGDVTRLIKAGMAPPSTTAAVWSDVPEAMLVRAQEASNWMGGQSVSPRKATNLGMSPALMIWWMGGCLSRDSSFLHSRPNRNSERLVPVNMFQGTRGNFKFTVQPVSPGAVPQHCYCSHQWESPQLSTVWTPASCHIKEFKLISFSCGIFLKKRYFIFHLLRKMFTFTLYTFSTSFQKRV